MIAMSVAESPSSERGGGVPAEKEDNVIDVSVNIETTCVSTGDTHVLVSIAFLVTKTWASLRKCTDSLEPSLHSNTKYGWY